MNGLEATELKLSDVISENIGMRLDAEFYKKEYKLVKAKLLSVGAVPLKTLISSPVLTGHTPSMANKSFYGGRINFIKTDNLRDNFIHPEFTDTLSDIGNDEIKNTSLQSGDVILTIIGATFEVVGRACLIKEDVLPANINQNIALIRLKQKLLPEYLSVYLNTKYGKKYLHYLSRQTEQVNLNCREVEQLLVPIFPNIRVIVKNLVDKAQNNLRKSKASYAEAENILLGELGLRSFVPSIENTAIKSYRKSFLATGRFDAEFYQPKYDQLKRLVKAHAVSVNRIESIAIFNQRGEQPQYVADGKLKIINSRHILEQHLDYDNFERTNAEEWDRLPLARVFRNDILIYTTGANVGRTNVYLSDERALASNHVNILRIENANPIYVGFVLNSYVGRMQTKQTVTGSAQAELYPNAIAQFVVPFISDSSQRAIVDNVEKSLDLQIDSKRLLKTAKRAIEIAIEENEQAALKFIRAAQPT